MHMQSSENGIASKGFLKSSEGLVFASNRDGTCTLKKVGKCRDLDIVIPENSPDGDTVTVIGKKAFAGCKKITSVYIPGTVTAIEKGSFENCLSLQGIVIPDGVTTIGKGAFSGCSSLERMTLPFVGGDKNDTIGSEINLFGYIFGNSRYKNGLRTEQWYTDYSKHFIFYLPSALKEVNIIGGVIGRGAFSDCTNLKSIIVGNGVTSIGYEAFSGCSSLESMILPFVGENKNETSASKLTLFGYIFGTSYYTGGVATEQWFNSWSYNAETYYIPSTLKSVTITGGNILYQAFHNCKDITSVTIGDSVTSIGEYAFRCFPGLTSVTICNGVTSIEDWAFCDCSNLTSITIPDSVTRICSSAFRKCTSLTSIHVSENNSCYKLIDGNLYSKDGKTLIRYAIGKTEPFFTIPNSVTSIGAFAFSSCTSLTSVTIPNSVTRIGFAAFDQCTSLTSITIPDSVTEIEGCAFCDCTSLTSITIPDSVTSIGRSAFCDCHSLTSITIPDSVISIGVYAFSGCHSLKSITFVDINTWYRVSNSSDWENKTGGTKTDVWNTATNAKNFTNEYCDSYFYKI